MDDEFGSSVPPVTGEPSPDLDDIQLLRQEVLNEKLAPRLLPHKSALLQRVRSAIDAQEEVIEELEGDHANLLAVQMYQQEKARVTWLVKEYLRVRIRKLERHVVAYMKDMKDEEEAAEESGLLSEQEKAFLEHYFLALGRHYRTMVLSQLPDDYQSLVKSHKDSEEEDMVDRPALDRHVFCRVLQDAGIVRISDDGVEVGFEAGDLYVVRFDFIADLLARGQAALV